MIVNPSTNRSALYGELGRVPLKVVRQINMLRYWLKIQKCNDNSLVKQMYLMLKRDVDNNISYNGLNWAYQVKSILDRIGLSEMWHDLSRYNEVSVLNFIKQRIKDVYCQT